MAVSRIGKAEGSSASHGGMLGNDPLIHDDAQVVECELGRFTEVGARTRMLESAMGDYSYIVQDGEITYSRIGKFCSIASHVRINPGNHPMWRPSQSHFTYRSSRYWEDAEDDAEIFEWRQSQIVEIGHDVWIGHGAVILAGRSIGTGSVIAAGAVVTADVAPYTIVAGVPAKPVRRRFTEQQAHAIESVAWWDWSHEDLREALPDFRTLTIDSFLKKYT